ncbi:hypothetical protein TPR58_07620 [Sphingomonas sp. HF-S3]|uniref:Transposase n=1 Tax=Sphingomonas rustica TaxID=3103142 RepID=A0ABV0B801_9SPHN
MLYKRDLAGAIEVDGQTYAWELQREPQWCTAEGWRGMTVAVWLVGAQRQAILEFPMPTRTTNGSPQRQRPKLNGAVAINGVRAALAAGWEPTSRGRPVIFMVDANGC